jgi:hypothetical protein
MRYPKSCGETKKAAPQTLPSPKSVECKYCGNMDLPENMHEDVFTQEHYHCQCNDNLRPPVKKEKISKPYHRAKRKGEDS